MCANTDNDTLASLIKAYPLFGTAIENIMDSNKKTTSMFIHELRNPLSLMKGTIQYIETKHPETREYKYWDQLHDLVKDLENMMADASLLNTCNSINKDTTDLLALIHQVKNNFMPQAINQKIDLSIKVEEGCEPYFTSYSCDAGKLKQVMSNLIKNAFEATSQGDFIHITLRYLPAQGEALPKLSVVVSNNGLPIPEYEIGHIFTPFITYKKGGTGVGLAIVKKIIELHYGTICVSSDESLTSFTILLPL